MHQGYLTQHGNDYKEPTKIVRAYSCFEYVQCHSLMSLAILYVTQSATYITSQVSVAY